MKDFYQDDILKQVDDTPFLYLVPMHHEVSQVLYNNPYSFFSFLLCKRGM